MISVKKKDYGTGIPQHDIEMIARCLLPKIQEFYETEEGKREFAEWKKRHNTGTEAKKIKKERRSKFEACPETNKETACHRLSTLTRCFFLVTYPLKVEEDSKGFTNIYEFAFG